MFGASDKISVEFPSGICSGMIVITYYELIGSSVHKVQTEEFKEMVPNQPRSRGLSSSLPSGGRGTLTTRLVGLFSKNNADDCTNIQ